MKNILLIGHRLTIPLYKEKSDALIKPWPIPWAKPIRTWNEDMGEIVAEAVTVGGQDCSHQCGFISGKSTSDAVAGFSSW